MFLLYGWALYRFCDHGGFHSSSTTLGFLESWWFRGFLRGCLILRETAILVWFYAFICFGCFRVTNEHFIDFLIFVDYIAQPWCLGFQSVCGLGVPEGVD